MLVYVFAIANPLDGWAICDENKSMHEWMVFQCNQTSISFSASWL